MDDVRVEGDLLAVDVRYGGGCRTHEVDAVVWTGWMEFYGAGPATVVLRVDAAGGGLQRMVSYSF